MARAGGRACGRCATSVPHRWPPPPLAAPRRARRLGHGPGAVTPPGLHAAARARAQWLASKSVVLPSPQGKGLLRTARGRGQQRAAQPSKAVAGPRARGCGYQPPAPRQPGPGGAQGILRAVPSRRAAGKVCVPSLEYTVCKTGAAAPHPERMLCCCCAALHLHSRAPAGRTERGGLPAPVPYQASHPLGASPLQLRTHC